MRKMQGYLPHRQLRNITTACAELIDGYLPHRQLRNC